MTWLTVPNEHRVTDYPNRKQNRAKRGAHSFGRVELPTRLFSDGRGVGNVTAQRRHDAGDVRRLSGPRLPHEEDLGRILIILLCRSILDLFLPVVCTLDVMKRDSKPGLASQLDYLKTELLSVFFFFFSAK